MCTQWFPPEKAGLIADIADGLHAGGHEVTVLTGFPNYPTGKVYDGWRQRPWQNFEWHGYRVKRVVQFPSHDASPARRAASYLSFGLAAAVFGWRDLRSADVVYVYHPPLTTVIGPWLSKISGGAPYVLHVQDLWPDSVVAADMLAPRSAGVVARVLDRVCRVLYRGAAAVVCIAPTMAQMLRDRGTAEDRLDVVPNWADETVFSPTPRDESVAEALGLAGRTSVMFAGNLGPVQGLETAVRAAARVQDLPDFRLVLVGDGVARPDLERLVDELGATNVMFLGSRPLHEMNAITAAADVQLVSLLDRPFLRGTIPSKLGSVMASGLPVICAAGGDARRLVENAGAGWTCESEDVDGLERAFRSVHAASQQERRERGSAGRAYYEATMAASIGVGRIEQILQGAARR
ncbi:glycosyltransferase family 4 protein [Blastococcus sp. SYSU DS0552]